jgi:hypothetical protein
MAPRKIAKPKAEKIGIVKDERMKIKVKLVIPVKPEAKADRPR